MVFLWFSSTKPTSTLECLVVRDAAKAAAQQHGSKPQKRNDIDGIRVFYPYKGAMLLFFSHVPSGNLT